MCCGFESRRSDAVGGFYKSFYRPLIVVLPAVATYESRQYLERIYPQDVTLQTVTLFLKTLQQPRFRDLRKIAQWQSIDPFLPYFFRIRDPGFDSRSSDAVVSSHVKPDRFYSFPGKVRLYGHSDIGMLQQATKNESPSCWYPENQSSEKSENAAVWQCRSRTRL